MLIVVLLDIVMPSDTSAKCETKKKHFFPSPIRHRLIKQIELFTFNDIRRIPTIILLGVAYPQKAYLSNFHCRNNTPFAQIMLTRTSYAVFVNAVMDDVFWNKSMHFTRGKTL